MNTGRIRYDYWTKPGKNGRLKRDAGLCAIEEAIPIMRDSVTHSRMMVQAIFAVKLAFEQDDKTLGKAISKKFEEINKLIQQHPQD